MMGIYLVSLRIKSQTFCLVQERGKLDEKSKFRSAVTSFRPSWRGHRGLGMNPQQRSWWHTRRQMRRLWNHSHEKKWTSSAGNLTRWVIHHHHFLSDLWLKFSPLFFASIRKSFASKVPNRWLRMWWRIATPSPFSTWGVSTRPAECTSSTIVSTRRVIFYPFCSDFHLQSLHNWAIR